MHQLKKQAIILFVWNTILSQNASKNKKKEPKKDKKLFAQLFIAAQVRIGNVQGLLQHEAR